jgi:ABC-2 type transport system permease protein
MGDLALVARQARFGLITASRNPRVMVFGIVFPVFLLVLFNGIFTKGGATTTLHGQQLDADTYFTAAIAAYAIFMSCFNTLAISLTTQRETGQLKRLRGTPMPAWTFVAAQIVRSIAMVVVMVTVLLAIGAAAFGVDVRASSVPSLVLYVALGTAATTTLGIGITALLPTAEAASSIVPFGTVILSFISGVFIPVSQLPDWLAQIGRVFPLYHLADGLQSSFLPGGHIRGGNVAVLVLWGVGGLVMAARRFRWEPQGAGA